MNLIDILPELINRIKSKKELKTVDENWIREELLQLIEKRKEVHEKIEGTKSFSQFSRSNEYDFLLKIIRADLHAVYGTFQQELNHRKKYFEELKKIILGGNANETKINELHQKILSTHTSTKERLKIYPVMYEKIFAVTGIPKKLLDLSCGLNPLSYPFMDIDYKDFEYSATEITKEDCELINEYFEMMKIKGKALQIDLVREYEKIKQFDVDVCFLFKLLDTLEYLERNISKKILPLINSKWLVVSFSTKTLSGKKMKKIERWWFENICTANKWTFEKIEFDNELFYVVKK